MEVIYFLITKKPSDFQMVLSDPVRALFFDTFLAVLA